MLKDKYGHLLSSEQLAQKITLRLKALLEELILFLIHWLVNFPSHTVRKGLCQIIGIKVGPGSSLHHGLTLYTLGKITIGSDTIIGEKTTLDGRGNLIIGNHVDIASEVMIYTSQHDLNDKDFKPLSKPVVIKDYVFIGPRAIILPGVTIGKASVVAAGAVVTKDVAEAEIVAGIPAKPIAKRQLSNPNYLLGRARLFR